MSADLEGIRLIVFDADGTLRRSTVKGQPCPNGPGESEIIPGVRETIERLQSERPELRYGIASNQGGVGLGYMGTSIAYEMLEELAVGVFGREIPAPAIQMCPHAPKAGCICRKPEPKMILRIGTLYLTDPAHVLFVGDQESDRETAERAGCRFAWAADFFGW